MVFEDGKINQEHLYIDWNGNFKSCVFSFSCLRISGRSAPKEKTSTRRRGLLEYDRELKPSRNRSGRRNA